MSTQLQATPTVYGEQAKQIINEARKEPSQQAIENAKRLMGIFEKVDTSLKQ